ncbi:dimethyl sulfoxide reductase anchor subunit family protein [Corynebacterium cystitidis]|uniref:Anaerobic dimethyl sulfoxide reductase subunit C (DMSO reductase anchor subunit) n=1 Tax=Corynebacterium cystitidis DSM 20524 TaxID=1121357 RepID=A0A1H9R3A5_9CORY|nr:DmsC/YnfH family molybdoenzyme membrane anchor subunit [Corynebacterium cystitidis]WJY81565.1 Anaerobic dimethyl sulfoxide reductase chain C [Corynebacterium cystitidis DSM 20524]SER67206.1 anaerobic dimethyl sulfoxide reductase subunit C (DMSO reductase anchor subunit) [Corynebacterium cystitidis DSM 20524]SNV86142.1 dimethyl sulfoxide reductase chain C [Corynebacterium cystitidis]
MNLHEWPLTFFTVFGQMAVGAFFVLGCITVFGRLRFSSNAIDRICVPALYAIGPIMIAGFVLAFFHLGNPLNAPNVIRNIGSSGLTQELVAGCVFAGLGFLFAASQFFDWFTVRVRAGIAVLTALVGLGFIYTMANLYMLPTIPAWNRWTTPASFYLSGAVTGLLAIAVALTAYNWLEDSPLIKRLIPSARNADQTEEQKEEVWDLISASLRWIGIALTIVVPLIFIVMVFIHSRPAGPNEAEFAFNTTAFVIRICLLLLGAFIVGLILAFGNRRTRPSGLNMTLITVAYIAVVIAELVGRFLFYGAIDKVGI